MTATILTDEQIRDLHVWDMYDFARAIEQAVLQSEQVQAWKKDAERIQWVEGEYGADIVCFDDENWEVSTHDVFGEGSSIREAIDAAMEKQP